MVLRNRSSKRKGKAYEVFSEKKAIEKELHGIQSTFNCTKCAGSSTSLDLDAHHDSASTAATFCEGSLARVACKAGGSGKLGVFSRRHAKAIRSRWTGSEKGSKKRRTASSGMAQRLFLACDHCVACTGNNAVRMFWSSFCGRQWNVSLAAC